jgi:peptide/nickel transport system substrate-binding protein
MFQTSSQAMHKQCQKVSRTALLASGLWAASLAASSAETLTIAVPSDPGYLDPAYWGSTVDQFLIDNLYPRLAKYVPGDEWVVELDAAKSMDFSDPMQIGFELHSGIMWTGGYGELTAEDVAYSFERHLDPDVESAAATEFASMVDVEVTGRYTGIIHLSEPSATFWPASLVYTSGAIISQAAADENDGYFEATPVATTGPYMLQTFEPGNRLVLERNPDWAGEPVDFDEIVLLPIADENAAELAFAAGEVDYTITSSGNYDALLANMPDQGVVTLRQTLDPLFLGISQTYEGLADARVRQAIQLALDIPTILAATTGGHAQQATGFVAPGLIGHRDETAVVRDLNMARSLLAEAGAEGLVIRLDYVNNTQRDTAAQIMQANLAEVGIMLDLNGQDEGTFWSVDEMRAADLQLHLKAWTGNPEAYYMLQYFVEDQIGVWNWEGYASDEYAALLDSARTEVDTQTRGEIYVQLQTLLEDSGSFVFFDNEPTVTLHRDTIIPGALPDGRPVFEAFRLAD